MAASRDLRSHVTDVVTCPICLELFDSPKSLPCLHTFCLKCIEGHCRDNEPGDEVACPMCRQKFNIPVGGVAGLVSNFFVADLVEARKTATDMVVRSVPCEVCLLECDDNSNVAVSTMYCVNCNQKLCELCSRPHRRWKGGPHRVVPIGSEVETELIQMQGGKCEKHKDKSVELYCSTCKLNICLMCFAVEHKHHDSNDINTVAVECVEQIDTDLTILNERADAARKEISRLDGERDEYLSGIENVTDKLLRKGEELKQLIDAQVNELMDEVQVLKTEKCKEIESHKENVEMKLMAFETFGAFCSELKSKGKPCDITRAANDLHKRATELLQNYVTLEDYCAPVVTFIAMDIHELLDDEQNFIGKIKLSDEQLEQLTTSENSLKVELKATPDREQQLREHLEEARVVHTLPEAEAVMGVTSLDDELYVIRAKAEDCVEVYNTTTTTTTTLCPRYSLLRHLSVPGLKGLSDMTSCKHYRCLYISDYTSKCVHRVELNGKVTKWSVNYKPCYLSVTSQFTVIVACSKDSKLCKLLELTTEGKQLREINLQSDIVNPCHAIQLSNGQFVVCHGDFTDPVNRVCIVDTNGHVTQSYGGPPGSATVGLLDVPRHLAVDKDGFIFVVDCENRRVLLLSPTLSFVREIVSRDQLKWKPRRLFLDVDRRRLYVADNEWKDGKFTTGRVVVVQL